MNRYFYRAVDSNGLLTDGYMDGESAQAIKDRLFQRGLIPKEVRRSSISLFAKAFGGGFFKPKVKADDLIIFTRQLGVMIKTGVPLIKALHILEEQTENKKLKSVALSLTEELERGDSISAAFSNHPDVFSQMYVSLLRAGEQSGALDEIMVQITDLISHEEMVRREVKSAMRYPLFVIGFLATAFVVVITFVIPKLQAIFTKARIELPWPTKVCIALSKFFNEHWYVVLLGLVGLVVLYKFIITNEKTRAYWDRFWLRCPYIGPLLVKAAMSRFSKVFSILQYSGVGVLESLSILSGVIGNSVIAHEFDRLRELLKEGESISEPLRTSSYFPPLVVSMIAIGENSGELDSLMNEVSIHYDIELKYAIKKVTDLLPGLLVICVAVMVGFFAMAVYLPLFNLTKLAG